MTKERTVWVWHDSDGDYAFGRKRPKWDEGDYEGDAMGFECPRGFELLFPFFTMPPKSVGKIVNTKNTLTFEIVETKGD